MIFQSQDEQIKEFLQKSEVSKKYSWNNSVIKGTSTYENPFNFLIIKDLISKEGFKDKSLIKIYSDDCFSINFSDEITKIDPNPEKRNIIYKNEIDITKNPQPNKEINYSVISSYNPEINQEPYFYHPISKFKIKETQIFTVSLTNFEIKGCELFEPILFTAFLLNEKSPISEFWNFAPDPTQILMEKFKTPIQLNQKAAFHIGSTSMHTSLIILITRVAQPNQGSACDKVYLKKSTSQLKAAQESLSHTLDNLFQPFAVTFAPIAEILAQSTSGEPFIMPEPCEIDINKTKLKDLSSHYQNATKYPFKISLTGRMQITTDQSSTLKDGYIELQSLGSLKPGPNFQFHHKLTITLSRSTFSKKPSKDVYCIVSYCEGGLKGNEKPYIRAKYTNKLVSTANSFTSQRCEKSIVFNDQFTIELPPTITEKTFVTFEFISTSFKKGKQELIGVAFLPLMINGGFVKDGKKELNVFDSFDTIKEADWKATNSQINAVIRTHLFSSLVSSDAKLNELFEGKKSDLSNADPNELLTNIFQVVNVLTSQIKTNEASEAIYSFEKVALRIAQVYEDFEEFLMFYALNFALREGDEKSFHINLLSAWGEKLEKDSKKRGSERFDVYLVDFYFILIIKSIYVTKDSEIDDSLLSFVKNWSISIPPLVEFGLIQAKKFIQSFGHFLNMLSEIGFYSLAIECFATCASSFGNTENDRVVVSLLLYSTFTPKFFCVSILNNEKLPNLCLNFVEKTNENPLSLPSEFVYGIFLKIFSHYDNKTSQLVTERLVDCLTPLCKLFLSLSANKEMQNHSSFIFFLFLISNSTLESFKKWWTKTDSETKNRFFELIHFLIDNVKDFEQSNSKNVRNNILALEKLFENQSRSKNRAAISAHKTDSNENESSASSSRQKELCYSMNFSILHVLDLIIKIIIENCDEKIVYNPSKPLTVFSQVTKVIYHLMCSNFALDALPVISEMINGFASKKIELLFNQCCPVLPKFTIKVILNGQYWPDILSFIDAMHEADKKRFKNDNRTMAVMTRSIYLLNSQEALKNIKSTFLSDFVSEMIVIDDKLNGTDPSRTIEFEDKCDLLYRKSELLKYSPDARYEVLGKLAELEHDNEYFAEEIQVFLLQAALVIEHLALLGKLPKSLFGLDHAAKVMKDLSTVYSSSFCSVKDADLPIIPSFCDSPYFTIYSLTKLVERIVDTCNTTRYFEVSGDMIDIAWPLLENRRSFSLLKNIMREQADSFSSLAKIAKNDDRLFGKYYRVSFYGKLFDSNDQKVFIYREKKLTHLYEISSRIVDAFKKLHGDDRIELIKESGPVDVKSLDDDKGYIQITFVEPFKSTEKNRSSQFFFDTPFIKENEKSDKKSAQGTVDKQWLRRTVLTVSNNMPFIVKRQKVANIKTIEIEPIRVAYRQLRERVAAMREAVKSQDMRQVQQLLHGSLLVQVNEGPTKMAEVFLGDGKEETKYTLKMKNEFREFLTVNQEGLKLHAQWCMENTEFIPLQHELDSGFQSLKEKLEAYLE